ncbi:MAG: head-tail adaptor protein [Proteobacteria bacterium]|nr:head-tail adaptor protein [Pseudomonadota bacterium]
MHFSELNTKIIFEKPTHISLRSTKWVESLKLWAKIDEENYGAAQFNNHVMHNLSMKVTVRNNSSLKLGMRAKYKEKYFLIEKISQKNRKFIILYMKQTKRYD